MRIRFVERTNADIDQLVSIAWEARRSHEGEYFQIPQRTEAEINQLINDGDTLDEFIGTNAVRETVSSELFEFSDSVSVDEKASVFQPSIQRLVIAVDSGVVDLGEFIGGGLAFAVRGAAICLIDDEVTVLRYSTGPLLIDERNQVPVFRYIGQRLGKEDLYLFRGEDGELMPSPSAFETGNQLRDRCRNFVERIIQEEALSILVNNQRGLLLIDGALPAGTFDTPQSYLRTMLQDAAQNKIDIAAISKKSRVTVGGRPISAVFDDSSTFVGFVPLKEEIASERERYVEQGMVREASQITLANELFAVRFGLGPPALTFRADVHNSIRSTPSEVLCDVFDQCQIQGCYPKPLIEAHQFSSFLFQDIQTLTADLIARTGARSKEDPSMEWMFIPFGSFGK